MTLAAFIAAWFVHLLAAASPGPTILMAARTGVTEGLRTGVFLAIGFGAGALFWAVAALFGLSVVFQTAPALLWGFKILGGVFLCWIAFKMWKHAADPLDLTQTGGRPLRAAHSALLLGFKTQLANPKPAVFFGAVFVGTVPPGTSLASILLLLSAVFLNEVFCATVVARAFSFDGPRRTYVRLKARIDRTFGGILALLGAKIAFT